MYRVLIVDDQPVFRDIYRSMLDAAGGFEVVGEAGDGTEAVQAYRTLRPDLVVMDIQMGPMDGFEGTARILESDPEAAVVLTSMKGDPEYARAAVVSGALAFFMKRDLDMVTVRSLVDEHTASRQSQPEAA